MQSLKKAFRLLGLSALIILASFGVGLSGGIAIPISRRKENNPISIELAEFNKEKPEADAEEERK